MKTLDSIRRWRPSIPTLSQAAASMNRWGCLVYIFFYILPPYWLSVIPNYYAMASVIAPGGQDAGSSRSFHHCQRPAFLLPRFLSTLQIWKEPQSQRRTAFFQEAFSNPPGPADLSLNLEYRRWWHVTCDVFKEGGLAPSTSSPMQIPDTQETCPLVPPWVYNTCRLSFSVRAILEFP